MSNPIKSAKVYFDEKKGVAILCLDGPPRGPSPLSPCMNTGSDFHTHAWVEIGSISEVMLLTDKAHRGGAIPRAVLDMLFSVNDVRTRYETMEREHREAVAENHRLARQNRSIEGLAHRAIQSVVGEDHRLRLLKSLSEIMAEVN